MLCNRCNKNFAICICPWPNKHMPGTESQAVVIKEEVKVVIKEEPKLLVSSMSILELVEKARPDLSRTKIKQLLIDGAVKIDDVKVTLHTDIITEGKFLTVGKRGFFRLCWE